MIANNNPSRIGRIKHAAHSFIALAFLFVPLLTAGLFLYNTGAGSLSAWSERGPNEEIAACKVTSDDAVLFDEPIISFTFDDGWSSMADNAAPILCDYKVASTQYVMTGELGNSAYMSPAQMDAMHTAGHEIASHSITHMDLGKASEGDVVRELEASKTALAKMGLIDPNNVSFAYPYGSHSELSDRIGKEHYASLRTTGSGEFDPSYVNTRENFDKYRIKSFTISNDTSIEEFRKFIDYTKQTNGWYVLALHQVDDSAETYSITSEQLRSLLDVTREEGVKIMTMRDALETYDGDNS